MSENYYSLQVSDQLDTQFPAFVRENHPKFIEFLTNYYTYLDQQENINDYIHHVLKFIDIDTTTQNLLDNFFEELRNFPNALVVDKRLLAKHIHDFYAAKGTPQSFQLLFRILFNEEIEISYPSAEILRASDGVWKQDVFITVNTISGDLPIDGSVKRIQFNNKYGHFDLLPTKVGVAAWVSGVGSGVATYRIHFHSYDRIILDDDQLVYCYDANNIRTFVGRLVKSPAKLTIVNGGKFWQPGAIFKIPGTVQDTIGRVVSVSTGGEMAKCEIVQFGYGHSQDQIVTFSPFPSKPVGSNIVVSKTLISFNPNVWAHEIEVTDVTETSEAIIGYVSEMSLQSYFLENYDLSGDYSSVQFLSQVNTSLGSTDFVDGSTDISLDDWLASRTTIVYEYANIARETGYFDSDRGKISNSTMRLSDNRYYQLYSYVIRTGKQISDYRNALTLVHPAGLKYFSEIQKQFDADMSLSVDVYRQMSTERLYSLDISGNSDVYAKTGSKVLSDDTLLTETLSSSVSKYTSDNSTFEDTSVSDVTIAMYESTQHDFFAEDYNGLELMMTIVN